MVFHVRDIFFEYLGHRLNEVVRGCNRIVNIRETELTEREYRRVIEKEIIIFFDL
jgi:hypothetical protein